MPDAAMITIEKTPCLKINMPDLFEVEGLLEYVRAYKLATWHMSSRGKFGEYSDLFVTYDSGEGSNSDMPGWDKISKLMEQEGISYALLWITNLE